MGDQILVSSEAPDETAFPRASWRVRVVAVVGRVDRREAVLAGAEPRRVAETNDLGISRLIWSPDSHCS